MADRSYSENYISPLIVSGWYILLQVEIPVLFKKKKSQFKLEKIKQNSKYLIC